MDYLVSRLTYIAILIVGSAIGLIRWKRNSTAFKLLAVIIWTVLLFDGTGIIVRILYSDISVYTYRIFGPLEISLYTAMFLLLIKNRKLRWPVMISAALVVAYVTVYDLTRSNNSQLDSLPILIKCYYCILLSLAVFQEYIASPNESNILKEQTFWFIAAVLFQNTMVIMYWSCYMLMTTSAPKSLGETIMITSNLIYYVAIAVILNMLPVEKLNKANEIS